MEKVRTKKELYMDFIQYMERNIMFNLIGNQQDFSHKN